MFTKSKLDLEAGLNYKSHSIRERLKWFYSVADSEMNI